MDKFDKRIAFRTDRKVKQVDTTESANPTNRLKLLPLLSVMVVVLLLPLVVVVLLLLLVPVLVLVVLLLLVMVFEVVVVLNLFELFFVGVLAVRPLFILGLLLVLLLCGENLLLVGLFARGLNTLRAVCGLLLEVFRDEDGEGSEKASFLVLRGLEGEKGGIVVFLRSAAISFKSPTITFSATGRGSI